MISDFWESELNKIEVRDLDCQSEATLEYDRLTRCLATDESSPDLFIGVADCTVSIYTRLTLDDPIELCRDIDLKCISQQQALEEQSERAEADIEQQEELYVLHANDLYLFYIYGYNPFAEGLESLSRSGFDS